MDFNDMILAGATRAVEKYGVHITGVGAGPATYQWAYTTGLTAVGHPELVILGLLPLTAQSILNDLAGRVRAGLRLEPGDRLSDVLQPARRRGRRLDYDVVIAGPVGEEHDAGYPCSVTWAMYGQEGLARPLQVVFPDAAGRFPWEPASNLPPAALIAPAPAGGR